LAKSSAVLHRAPTQLPPPAPELARRYQRLTLGDVNLGFAGRHAPGHKVHRAISALAAGDALQLRQIRAGWELVDSAGIIIGRLARGFVPPVGMECIAAHVAAIITRWRDDEQPEFRERARCERWEVVVPDLVFAPKR